MPYQKLRQAYVGVARQSSRLAFSTTPTFFLPVQSLTADSKNEYIEDNSSFARRETQLNKYIGRQSVELNIESMLYAEYASYFIKRFYGDMTSVQDATTGAYTHTCATVNNNAQTSLLDFYYSNNDNNKRAESCQIKSLEFDFTTEGNSTMKVELLGIKETSIASPTIAMTKPTTFLNSKNMTAKYATTTSGLSGGTAVKIRNLNVKMNNDVKFDDSLNAGFYNDILNDGTSFEITFSLLVNASSALYDAFIANTKLAWLFECIAIDLPLIGTSTTIRPSISFTVAPSTLQVVSQRPLDDFMSFDCTIQAELSTANNYALQTVITNGVNMSTF